MGAGCIAGFAHPSCMGSRLGKRKRHRETTIGVNIVWDKINRSMCQLSAEKHAVSMSLAVGRCVIVGLCVVGGGSMCDCWSVCRWQWVDV